MTVASVIAAILLTLVTIRFWNRRRRLSPLAREKSMHTMVAVITTIMALVFLALTTLSLLEAVDARAAVIDVLGG